MTTPMTIQEAMKERHLVRRYLEKPIPAEAATQLRERIQADNQESGLSLTLVTDNADGLGAMAKLISKNVRNYIVLAGPDTPGLDEALGYWGADVMLFAQTLGLNSWWVGGMFNAKGAAKHLSDPDLRINGVIAVGYGATQGVPHKSKTAADISSYDGEAPRWFQEGVSALLLAPTALNKQAYRVRGKGSEAMLTCDSGHFAGIDLGIGRYHFEAGAGRDNFEWAEPR